MTEIDNNQRLYIGSGASVEDRLMAYDQLVEAHDAALERIEELTIQVAERNAWLDAAANTIERYAAKYGPISNIDDDRVRPLPTDGQDFHHFGEQ